MKILDRYLLQGFLKPFVYCLLIFLVLFIVIDAFNNLDEFLKNGFSIVVIFSYYFYFLPAVFVQVAPVSTLMAVLYHLGDLNRHNEISAIKASGVSSAQVLAPYLFLGLLLSFVVFLVNEKIVPRSQLTSTAIMQGLIEKGKKNLSERAIRNVAVYSSDNRMVFAREFEILNSTLHDVVILQDDPDQTLKSRLTAKKAQYEDGKWQLFDAATYHLNRRGDIIGEPVYSEKVELALDEKPEDFIKSASQAEFMSARELKEYRDNFKGGAGKKLSRRLSVDFHTKIAFPFISFFVILIGAPLAMRLERGSAMVGVGTSLLVVFIYYGLHSVCLALGKNGTMPPLMAAWFSNIFFGVAGIYLIKKAA